MIEQCLSIKYYEIQLVVQCKCIVCNTGFILFRNNGTDIDWQ